VSGAPHSPTDLSGGWTGIFSYPRDLPATGFQAVLVDVGGVLTGHVVEPRHDGTGTVEALIDGRRDGARVRFAKSYDGSDGDYDLVRYEGDVDAEGLEITGRWEIPGVWAGTFIMVREGGAAERVGAEAHMTADR